MKGSSFQMVVAGLGGQGVLYVTRLLAEAALRKGFSVLTSETHGMAQRGGTVVSHLKVGPFWSPMIRPSCADGLLALAPESAAAFGMFLKSEGWAVVNGKGSLPENLGCRTVFALDADRLALQIGSPKAANLVLLGYALGMVCPEIGESAGGFFCSIQDVRSLFKASRGAVNRRKTAESLYALEAGFAEARRQGG